VFVFLMVGFERTRDRRGGVPREYREQLGRQAAVLAWAGARGPVSGLAAFSIPLVVASGEPFPYRDVLLATTFVIIVISLLVSLTVAPFARAMGVRGDDDTELARTMDASLARAALDRLDAAVAEADAEDTAIPQEIVDRLRRDTQHRVDRARPEEDSSTTQELATRKLVELARAMVRAEQEELIRLRDEEGYPDALVRPKLHDLDVRLQALGTER